MSPPAVWDQIALDILKKMHAEGCSAGIISNTLMSKGYDFSRNAVIGKKSRLGLPKPEEGVRHQVLALRKNRQSINGKVAVARPKFFITRKPQPLGAEATGQPQDIVDSNPTGSNAILLSQSRDGECKAIIGYEDGDLSKAIVCGEQTPWRFKRGKYYRSSWCQHHHELYTQEDRPHR